jgi:diketogulonate reductase-like aldo/keto reductase
MERLYQNNEIRAIGVSNFLGEHLETLLESAEIVPAVNQIELHPSYQQAELADKCRNLGIAVEAYSPLGRGADLNGNAVTTIANAHNATTAQVVLAWHLAAGNIVIPKSSQASRIRENFAASTLTLSSEELTAITALESGARQGSDPAVASFTQM